MTTLETERLAIRNFETADWRALHEMIVWYASSEFAAYDHQWPTSPEEIRRITERFAGGDRYMAVCLKDTGRFVGFVSLNPEQKEDCRGFNIGYVFRLGCHGKGYATEACRAAIDYAFDALQAQRVVTGTATANRPSCRLLGRLGFRRMAESTCSFRKTQDGKPVEFLGYTYAISRGEWKGRARQQAGSDVLPPAAQP